MATSVQLEPTAYEAPKAAPSLGSNFSWIFTGNIIYALCQWVMLSVLAKLGSAAIVGQFALGLAIAAPVFMFTNLQLRAVQATDAHSEYSFADYFTLRFVASSIALVLIAGLVALLNCDAITRAVVLLVAAAKAIESLSDVIAGLLQKEERVHYIALSLIIRGLASAITFGLLFAQFRSMVLAVAGMLLTWLLTLILYDLRWAKAFLQSGERFWCLRRQSINRLLLLSLPLGAVMTLMSLNVNIPRYFLQYHLGPANLGIFASLAYVLVSVTLLVNALGESAITRLSRMFAAKEIKQFRSLLLKLVTLASGIVVIGVPLALATGRQVLTILYRPEYGEHVSVLAIMVTASGVWAIGSFVTYGLTSARRFLTQIPVISFATLTTTVTCVLLVPRYGLIGAALALLASSVVFVAGTSLILVSALKACDEEARG